MLLHYTLTVRFEPAGEVSRKLLVAATTRLQAGERIEVVYDPGEPANFEPLPIDESAPV